MRYAIHQNIQLLWSLSSATAKLHLLFLHYESFFLLCLNIYPFINLYVKNNK